MTTLLTIGTFDPPGLWHAHLLKWCERLAPDRIVVGVNTDDFVKTYKAPPLYTTSHRMAVLAQAGYEVVENNSAGRDLIDKIEPDILAIGSDWMPGRKDYLAQIDMTPEDFERLRCALIFMPNIDGISSSDVKSRARST